MAKNNPMQDLAIQDISYINRKRYSLIFFLRHFFKSSKILKKMDFDCRKDIAAKLELKKTSGNVFEVQRVKNISPREFHSRFAKPGIPVIFEKASADWPCAGKWTLEFLEKEYGDTEFNLVYHKGFTPADEAPLSDYHDVIQEKLSLKNLVQDIRTKGSKYLRFCPIIELKHELLKDLNLSWLKHMRTTALGCSYQSFIGAKGRTTPLHDDMTAFFSLLPFGKKKWTLFSTAYKPIISPEITSHGHNFSNVKIDDPDLNLYPGMNLIDRYECVLNEGDILYVPAWMWHEVENLEDSWGVGYRFPDVRQAIDQSLTFFLKRIFLTEPPFWKVFYYSFFNANINSRDKYFLTPKVYKD